MTEDELAAFRRQLEEKPTPERLLLLAKELDAVLEERARLGADGANPEKRPLKP